MRISGHYFSKLHFQLTFRSAASLLRRSFATGGSARTARVTAGRSARSSRFIGGGSVWGGRKQPDAAPASYCPLHYLYIRSSPRMVRMNSSIWCERSTVARR